MMTVGIPKPRTQSILSEAEILRLEYEACRGQKPRYWIISKRTRISIWNEFKNQMSRKYSEDEVPKLSCFLGINVLELEEGVKEHFIQCV